VQVPKPEQEQLQLFRGVVPSEPDVVIKPMFGNLAAFVNGNMFAALLGPAIGVRIVEPSTREELDGIDGVGPFGPEGRPMKEYAALPADWLRRPEMLSEWIRRAYEDVRALPPKPPKGAAKGR
jgi:TfoX/Sxy family transcriptional regulator of competence genes